MATEQLQTKAPTLAVTIPTPTQATVSSAIHTPTQSASTATTSPAPAAIVAAAASPALQVAAPATVTVSVSTPTSGMHSPPLSNTVEEEHIESSSAAAATKRPVEHTVEAATSSAKTPVLAVTDSSTQPGSPHTTDASSHNTSTAEQSVADESKKDDLRQRQQHQSKEKTIEHVLRQGKILNVSRRLRTRLEYAILKIRRGWSKYTLQEVESLIQPACSPRVTAKQIHQTISRQSSPRQSERKRVKKTYPAYEITPHHRSSSDPTVVEIDRDNDVEMASYHPSAPSTPTGRYRSRMPSLSQYKDSELFQPAKSLMDIATSKPEPGYVSPYQGSQSLYHQPGSQSPFQRYSTPEPLYRDATPVRDTYSQGNWSGYSTPAAPSTPVQDTIETFEDEELEENGVPSEAQAARTILMLSSPTRPPPRTLNQNYIFEMHSGSPTHSPTTSSPLVQFQTNASSTPSPDQTPSISGQSAPSYMEEDQVSSSSTSNQKASPYYASKPYRQPFSSLYGMGHGPSSPSPLSTALFPSPSVHVEQIKSHSRSSSPTLKRAVRFAAAATNASESNLSVDGIKEKISGLSGRMEYNSTVDNIFPESQPGHDDKKEISSASPYGPGQSSAMDHPEELYMPSYSNRASTPPQSSSYSMPYEPSSGASMASHGMRTPPPSGGKDMDLSHYSLGASTPRRRRDSGMVPPGSTDLSTMFRQSATSNTSSPHP